MPAVHLAPRQAIEVSLHPRRQDRRQRRVLRAADVQPRLRILGRIRGAVGHEHLLILPVQLAGAVPVERVVEGVLEVAVDVQVQLLLAQQRGILGHLVEQLERVAVAARVEGRPAAGECRPVDGVEDLAHARGVLRVGGADVVLDRVRAELQLVVQRGQRDGLVDVGGARGREGCGDDEEGRDQVWVPEGGAVDDGTAPVVSAEDDAGQAEVAGEGGDVI